MESQCSKMSSLKDFGGHYNLEKLALKKSTDCKNAFEETIRINENYNRVHFQECFQDHTFTIFLSRFITLLIFIYLFFPTFFYPIV